MQRLDGETLRVMTCCLVYIQRARAVQLLLGTSDFSPVHCQVRQSNIINVCFSSHQFTKEVLERMKSSSERRASLPSLILNDSDID